MTDQTQNPEITSEPKVASLITEMGWEIIIITEQNCRIGSNLRSCGFLIVQLKQPLSDGTTQILYHQYHGTPQNYLFYLIESQLKDQGGFYR